ncbi:MAG TPA: DUF432 domain-containing protein [Candidatus Cloacimonetes bacterium]|nr:DUF432 domain-containing protein [Candidatus Cloacimonadota bacterium]HEX38311.1 DUF432 domain-containing protein [Candidatus Cloacimonadota bacterium]
MYGTHDIPTSMKESGLSLDFSQVDYGYQYTCKLADNKEFNKIILVDKARVLINPVEPINLPKHITNYLMLEFDKNLTIAPHQEKSFFATFPIEIGIFIFKRREFEPIDIISLLPAKYSLYGDPRIGVVARYHKTEIYSQQPEVDKLHYGIIHITVRNSDAQWNTISKLVLNAYGMKLFYNEKLVKLYASMKINNEISAETECFTPPPEKGFKKAMELYVSKKIAITSSKFLMMEGI